MNFVGEFSITELGIKIALSHWIFGEEMQFDQSRLQETIRTKLKPLIISGQIEGEIDIKVTYREFAMECGEVKGEGNSCFRFHWRSYRPWWTDSDKWWEAPFCGRFPPLISG